MLQSVHRQQKVKLFIINKYTVRQPVYLGLARMLCQYISITVYKGSTHTHARTTSHGCVYVWVFHQPPSLIN